ncbi:MAG: LamG domain-containing protein, partial [Verrucomicrobiota bacterium]
WNFVISYFGQVLINIPLNEGSGTNINEVTYGLKGAFITNNPSWTSDTPSFAQNDFAVSIGGAGRKGLILDTNLATAGHFITLGPDNGGSNGDYTLQAWVKLPLGFEPATRMIIFSYEGVPGFVFSINTGRTLHTTTFGLNDVTSTTVVPNDNQWHHVAVAHQNGVGMKFFLDGALNSETAYVRGPGARTSFTISVGGSVGNLNNSFTGTIDRILVRKGALDASQLDFPAPVGLSILRNGNSVTLTWATAATGYVLQSAPALSSSGTVWSDEPGTPVVNGASTSSTVTIESGSKYYRLRKVQ